MEGFKHRCGIEPFSFFKVRARKFYVYVLRSEEGYRYIGHTPDLERRLSEHNTGRTRWTKRGHGWEVIYTESYESRSEAMQREKWLKSGVGREWLKSQIAGWSPPQAE